MNWTATIYFILIQFFRFLLDQLDDLTTFTRLIDIGWSNKMVALTIQCLTEHLICSVIFFTKTLLQIYQLTFPLDQTFICYLSLSESIGQLTG